MEKDPDLRGAPYPLLISSTEMANTLAKYVVSHGFVWVSVNGIHSYGRMHEQMYMQPLDILLALDKAASEPLEGLTGVIDADRTGVIGYSFDGYNTLAMSGARIDPEFYLSLCANPDAAPEWLHSNLCAFSCEPASEWELFTTQVPEAITFNDDGLWQPITDERIRAVMPMAAEGWWLFGEKGLGTIDRPVLMLTGTEDELYPQNACIFEHIDSPDKTMISFIGQDHLMIFITKQVSRIAHFTVAFFGYHLQGNTEYSNYYSEDFVNQFDDIAWGVRIIGR
jgi:predicted dienelactone hydrolase